MNVNLNNKINKINFFAINKYDEYKVLFTGKKVNLNKNIKTIKYSSDNNDPKVINEIFNDLYNLYDWNEKININEIINSWKDIVGENISNNTYVEKIFDETIYIKCKSTSWSTQLRLVKNQIIININNKYPELKIKDISFISPKQHNWKYGKRSVKGLGPRDTYG